MSYGLRICLTTRQTRGIPHLFLLPNPSACRWEYRVDPGHTGPRQRQLLRVTVDLAPSASHPHSRASGECDEEGANLKKTSIPLATPTNSLPTLTLAQHIVISPDVV